MFNKKFLAILLVVMFIVSIATVASAAPLPKNGQPHVIHHVVNSDLSGDAGNNLFSVKHFVDAVKDPFKGVSINNIL